MKRQAKRQPRLTQILELLDDTCNLLARKVQSQELEILRLRQKMRQREPGRILLKKKMGVN